MTEVTDKPKEKRVVILNPQCMKLREVFRQDWAVNAEAGTTIEDVLDPQYWAHIAAEVAPYSRIEVLLETGEWMLDLLVLGKGRNWLQVHLLHKYELERPAETLPQAVKHTVKWKGPQKKWSVLRISDSAMIHDGFGSKAEAQVWLANHERVTG